MYTVTRQLQFMGARMVEISAGGFDNVNPDMLVERYDHEGETFIDPRDAVDAAIEIYNLWRMDEPGSDIYIGYGDTFGSAMPFEASCIPDITSWSEKEYDALPKCDRCGDILIDVYQSYYIEDALFCSENCAQNACDEMFEEEY